MIRELHEKFRFVTRRPTAVSSTAAKEPFNLVRSQAVEIVWHGYLAGQETEPAHPRESRCTQRRNLDEGLACLCNDERLTPGRLLDQLGEPGLRFVNVHYFHVSILPMSEC